MHVHVGILANLGIWGERGGMGGGGGACRAIRGEPRGVIAELVPGIL